MGAGRDEFSTSLHRRSNHLWKLAGILSISEGTIPWIYPQHFELASKILEREHYHMTRFMALATRTTEGKAMDRILEIAHKAGGEVSWGRLARTTRGREAFKGGKRTLHRLVDHLVEAGLLERCHNTRPDGKRCRGHGVRITPLGKRALESMDGDLG